MGLSTTPSRINNMSIIKHSESARPKVSVIIPTHNRADLLPNAVTSVISQEYQKYGNYCC